MFIDRQSPAMPAISAHKKPVNADWQATVAEYIERVGVTDLDDPNAPKRKTPRTDAQLRELAGIERQKAERKAQAEYKAAQARLANGTAVHRQPNERKAVKAVKKGRPKTKTEMPTAKGQAVLDALKENKVYRVADWDMSASYLKIRAQIKAQVKAQMPGASDNDINDATWTEYKRVYIDGQ